MTGIEIAAVYGAATGPGRLAKALETAVEPIGMRDGTSVTRISLHDRPLETADGRNLADHDGPTRTAVAAIAGAHGVLIGSPVYRGSMPGALKNLLDLLPVEALRGKPVGLVVVGATHHHYLGVDRHLRDVLAWFGALPLPVSVYLTGEDFGSSGPGDAAREELHALADGLLELVVATRAGLSGPPPLAARRR